MKRGVTVLGLAIGIFSVAIVARADETASSESIPAGTVITPANWQQYRQFLPDGMADLFAGKYFWKMPPDMRMEVEPTVVDQLPKNYLATTEKYASQIKIVELPDGGMNLQGYHGGIPFPDPQEPHRGWKLLMDLWYRYAPHLIVDTNGIGCAIDGSGNTNCEAYQIVVRQIAFETDDGIPDQLPAPNAKYLAQWFMTTEPEQEKYTATLNIDYADLSVPEEAYVFLPALRRYQRVSVAARCAEFDGTDWTDEDFRSGFDSNMTELQADYLGHRKILAIVDPKPLMKPFPFGFSMPSAWPTPDLGKWQLRDVEMISVKKVPAHAKSYCYGNRVIYMDSHFFSPLWEELYDSDMKLWKFDMVMPQRFEVPKIGWVELPGADVEELWDLKRNHATVGAEGRPTLYVNEQAPAEFQDIPRYTTPAGLNLIMR
jgi:hypothetical protein